MTGAGRPESWEGRRYEILNEAERREVFGVVADYRGDVTLVLSSGESLTGYVFANEPDGDPPHLRLFPEGSEAKRLVAHAEIVGLEFSGADKAFGKSWDHWVKRWETARELMEKGLDPGPFEPQPQALD